MRLMTSTFLVALGWCVSTGTDNALARLGLFPQARPFSIAAGAYQDAKRQTQSRESNRRANDLDAPDEFDRTPLMRAAARNDLGETKKLLARGADVNAKTADDYTALMSAAFYGNADIVEFLLDSGADVNARHKSGLTALMEAAKQNLDAGDVIADYIGSVRALRKKGRGSDSSR